MNIVIHSITLVIAIIALLLSVASLVFKKMGPKGDKGDEGKSLIANFKLSGSILCYSYDDIHWFPIGEVKGPKGDRGPKGDKGDPGKDGTDATEVTVIKDGVELTSKMIENALTDSEGEIQFSKPVAAPSFLQKK